MTKIERILHRGFGIVSFWALLFLLPALCLASQPQSTQRVFASPEEARQALITAVEAKDRQALAPIFGPALQDLAPGDPVEEAAEFEHFSQHVAEGVELIK